jgi:serine/threonine-protein kinase
LQGRSFSDEVYLVMELLAGQTLGDMLEERGRLELGEILELLGQACDGVQAAHAAGIVHRDVKPDNLFLASRDGRAFVKILDFGISKFDPAITGVSGATQEGSMLGTPFYMPPEQMKGAKSVDARADVYALGVILYECAAGRKPFMGDTLPMLLVAIEKAQPARLEELRPELPHSFVRVVMRAMSPEPRDRYASAGELGAALAALRGASDGGPMAFERTALATEGARAGVEPEARATTGQPDAPDCRTQAAMARSAAATRTAPRWPLWLGGGAVVLGVAAASVWLVGRVRSAMGPPPIVAGPASESVVAPPAGSPAPRTAGGDDLDASAAAAAAVSGAQAPSSEHAGSARAPSSAATSTAATAGTSSVAVAGSRPPAAPPKGSSRPGTPTRSETKGLAKENPF